MSEPVGPDLLLPPRARLFHVGPPKTASTALQNTAAAHRAELLAHGVRYPGRGTSQRAAVAAFIGRRIGYGGAAHEPGSIPPDLAAWDRLLAEIDGDAERRTWFGHEYAAGADDATAARFVEALGPRTHVVITLRDYGAMLPSIWQEYNKAGNTGIFDDWLGRVLATPRPDDLAATFHRRHDHGALVRRWVAAAGAGNVTVVVLDPADHGLVFTAFEAMLGLPAGLLAGGEGSYANRSMSVPELELLRRLNDVVRDAGVEWRDYQRLVVRGAARRMLSGRRPAPGEQRLALPAWAVEPVLAEATRHVEEIRASGVRVVGDLDALGRRPRVRGEREPAHQDVALVPIEAAVEALAGLIEAAVPGEQDRHVARPGRATPHAPANVRRRALRDSPLWSSVMSRQLPDDLLLPPRARLFHIGPPKTASTTLQAAAADHREDLLAHGVRYPGPRRSHRHEVAAFVGRSIGWVGKPGASDDAAMAKWDALMAEVEADQERRILMGHEYAAGADDAMAERFVKAIGERVHVVITLRAYGSMLPSIWQEHNKAGNTGLFDDWLTGALARPRPQDRIERFHVRHDQGQLVRRWAAAAGPEKVTVVVLDPADHDFVFDVFEKMLGLPSGIFTSGGLSRSNRSLSVPELEMLRQLNKVLRANDLAWPDYQRLVANGAALRMLQTRAPLPDEQRLAIPEWALERVMDDMQRHVREIADSGVRVVGDLDLLMRPPRVRGADEPAHDDVTSVPIEAAAQALAGAISQASGRSWSFAPPRPAAIPPQKEVLAGFSVKDLVAELRRRLRRKAARPFEKG